jgi:hypothetical protein
MDVYFTVDAVLLHGKYTVELCHLSRAKGALNVPGYNINEAWSCNLNLSLRAESNSFHVR